MCKRLFTAVVCCVMFMCASAQQTLNIKDYVVAEELNDVLSSAQIEKMRIENPSQLIRMNRTLICQAMVVDKLWEEDFVQKGYLEDYLPKGMSYSENDIIDAGIVNPYKWELPQGEDKYYLYKLRRSGYYVVVMPRTEVEKRVQAQLHQYGVNE